MPERKNIDLLMTEAVDTARGVANNIFLYPESLPTDLEELSCGIAAAGVAFDAKKWEIACALYERYVTLGINYKERIKVNRSGAVMEQFAIAANRSAACYWETANTAGNLQRAEKNANLALGWAKECSNPIYRLKCINSLAIVYLFKSREVGENEVSGLTMLVHKAVELYQTLEKLDKGIDRSQAEYIDLKTIILNTLGVFHTAIAEQGFEPTHNLAKAITYLKESRSFTHSTDNTHNYVQATSNLVEANLQLIRLQISKSGKITQDDVANLGREDSEIVQLFSICSENEELVEEFRPELQLRQAHIYIILLEMIVDGKWKSNISLKSLGLKELSNLKNSLWELAYTLISEASDASTSQQNSYAIQPLEQRLQAIKLQKTQ